MSTVKPNIKIVEDPEGIILYDLTGRKTASNPDGYANLADYVKSSLLITFPGNNPLSYNIVTSGDTPRLDDIGYLVRPSAVGGKFISGVYTFQLILETSDGTKYKSNKYKKLLTKEADCCVEKLQNKFDVKKLMAGDSYQKKLALLSVALNGAKKAAKCQRFTEAQNIIETVLKNCQCDCCF